MSAESKGVGAQGAATRKAGLDRLADYAAPCALLVIAALFAIFKPVFLSPDNLIGIVYQVSIIGIMAVGMTFVIMTGGIDLSVGSVLAVAGVATAELLALTDSNLALSLAGLSIVRGAALLWGGPELHLIRGPASFLFIGSGQIGGVPAPVFIFIAI